MTITVFNTARASVSGPRAIYAGLAGENIIFGTSAFWTATHINALEIVGTTTVQVSGAIYANANGILVNGFDNSITVTDTGIVFGGTFGIAVNSGTTAITNAGSIGGGVGVSLADDGNSVFNAGTITGDGDAIQSRGGGDGDRVTNTGSIVSHFGDGIQFAGELQHVVTNTGVISALKGAAIRASTGFATLAVNNSGTLDSLLGIVGGSRADSILNTGLLIGSVALGDGDDSFDSSQGVVSGNIRGEAGNDALYGGLTDDVIDGGLGEDTLTGNDGNDRLTGGHGADDLDGAAGIDGAHYGTSFVYIIADLAGIIANVGEAFGDTFANIENLFGSNFDDSLYGDAGSNRLNGGSGHDLLDGRAGVDVLVGGTGNDRLVVDSVRDRVVELSGEGTDTVIASIAYTLGVFVENLTLTGTAALAGTGNSAGNAIIGNAGANILDGLLGSDVLTGGAGVDQFRFTTALDASGNVDTITDFTPGTDRIALARGIFMTLGGGAGGLQPGAFVTGSGGVVAGDANDRILYDRASGDLYYDPDGTGALTPTLFARVTPDTILTPTDFIVFG